MNAIDLLHIRTGGWLFVDDGLEEFQRHDYLVLLWSMSLCILYDNPILCRMTIVNVTVGSTPSRDYLLCYFTIL